MQSILQTLRQRFEEAFSKALPREVLPLDPLIRPAAERTFGDYQAEAVMGLARRLKKNPRELAQDVVKKLDLTDVCDRIEVAGPGFVNLFLKPSFLADQLNRMNQHPRLGIEKISTPFLHVADFSSPNLAKEMHVGHLRTTITGEVIARVIEFMCHPVERVNHVGDWGTQFGMLLAYIEEHDPDVLNNPDSFHVKDLEVFYRAAKQEFDSHPAFAERARQKVVQLQSGDEQARKIWQAFVNESLRHCHEIYHRLGVTLKDVGESFYNDRLPEIVDELVKLGLAKEDAGALCVFLEGFNNRQGDPLPMIIRKADGGYNYATTDLAALKYRVRVLGARRLIYVTDIRQQQHFAMLFAVARKAGWVGPDVRLDHIGYGMVLGADRKPFKTREGGNVLLKDLIQEGIDRARAVRVAGQRSKVKGQDDETIARAVGLAALKYADLSHNLASDYVFSWDKMLAMDGNTGPYMLYAYTRIRSIGRKGKIALDQLPDTWRISLVHPSEAELARVICLFADVVAEVSLSLRPNLLTDYLYTLARTFSTFYERKTGVSVLDAETDELKQSRLVLCALTMKALRLGLSLLSIEVVEEM